MKRGTKIDAGKHCKNDVTVSSLRMAAGRALRLYRTFYSCTSTCVGWDAPGEFGESGGGRDFEFREARYLPRCLFKRFVECVGSFVFMNFLQTWRVGGTALGVRVFLTSLDEHVNGRLLPCIHSKTLLPMGSPASINPTISGLKI